MKLVWHHNTWPWGKTVHVVKSDGSGIVGMSFEDDNPGVCFLFGLSVIEPNRRRGIAKCLMLACESYCIEHGISRMELDSVLVDWVQDFYKKCGFVPIEEDGGLMRMYKNLK